MASRCQWRKYTNLTHIRPTSALHKTSGYVISENKVLMVGNDIIDHMTNLRVCLAHSCSSGIRREQPNFDHSVRELSAFDIVLYNVRRPLLFPDKLSIIQARTSNAICLDLNQTHFIKSRRCVWPAPQNLYNHSLVPWRFQCQSKKILTTF